MKFREGFVSNSSSSSFVLFVRKGSYDNVFSEMTAIQKDFCQKYFKESVVMGIPVMRVSGDTNDCNFFDGYYPDGELANILENEYAEEGTEGLWQEIEGLIQSLPKTDWHNEWIS
jgi:hypothetical protein